MPVMKISLPLKYVSALALFSWLLAPAAVYAQAATQPLSLVVRADRADATYEPNEDVTFSIRAVRGDETVDEMTVQWEVSKDNYYVIKSGESRLEGGVAQVMATLDEPGFLTLKASYSGDGKPVTAEGAAAIAPLEIPRSLPAPDDFDAFWGNLKEQQAQIPFNLRTEEVPTGKAYEGRVQTVDFWADALEGQVSGYLSRPVGAKQGSLPALLLVHGAGILSARQGHAEKYAAEGMLAMDINAHGLPNGMGDAYYRKLALGELRGIVLSGLGDRETIYFKGMYLRVLRALDVLASQPEWDGKNIIIVGASQGGAQALVGGGLDPRVTFVGAMIPAMVDPTGGAANRISGMRRLSRKDENGVALPGDLEALRYYDSVNFSERVQGEVFFALGFLDKICPPTAVYAAYNTITGKKQVFNDIDLAHRSSHEASRALWEAIRASIAAKEQAPTAEAAEQASAPAAQGTAHQ